MGLLGWAKRGGGEGGRCRDHGRKKKRRTAYLEGDFLTEKRNQHTAQQTKERAGEGNWERGITHEPAKRVVGWRWVTRSRKEWTRGLLGRWERRGKDIAGGKKPGGRGATGD